MLRNLSIFIATLALSIQNIEAAFKDCSEVDFCNDLRHRIPENGQAYTADLKNYRFQESNVIIPLINRDGSQLSLTISALEGEKYRFKIEEPGSHRYQLLEVLKEEPKKLDLVILESGLTYDNNSITLEPESGSVSQVEVTGSPFSVNIYYNYILSVSFDGKRLIMEEKENSSPFAFAVEFPQAKQLYGIHEHADILALRNTIGVSDPYRLKNLDAAGYKVNSPMSNYGAIPVLYGHGTSHTSGIFLQNAAEQWYDIDDNKAYVMVQSALMDIFVLLGPTPTEVVRQYTSLTGVHHLPQLWTLGYHQCRWNYENQEDVENVIANMDSHNFPMDAIWLDIDYTNGRRYFTWDPVNFNDPPDMLQKIAATNRKLVTIIDPHIKIEDNYSVYKGAKEADLFIKLNDGVTDFVGECWPGNSSYIDFMNPKAREYYGNCYSLPDFWYNDDTLAGIWNDMNEPSVFGDIEENTMLGDAIHTDKNGVKVAHRDVHNIYGFTHTMATHQGLMARDNNSKRPFILTRSHFAGSQRYAAIWTGDNQVGWEYLKISYPQCLNANILGIAFCGADVGGFDGGTPSKELLMRWYQAAAWTPFYREHSILGSDRREPYVWDNDTQQIIRGAMKLRYKHLPVWYTLFYEHTRNGDPVLKPLFYQYPFDEAVFSIDDQLLVGSDILIKSIYEPNIEKVGMYFPGGEDQAWYSLTSDSVILGTGLHSIGVDISFIPMYYRGGSVIARKDIERSSSTGMINDPYTIYINLDKDGNAYGTLYLDDYTSFNYENNDYTYVNLTYHKDEKNFIVGTIDSNSTQAFEIVITEIILNDAYSEGLNGKYITKKFNQTSEGTKLDKIRIISNTELKF